MRFHIRTSVAAIALSGFIGTAHAADMVAKDQVVDWSGFYLGADVGYGMADMSGCVNCGSTSVASAENLDINGIVAGLHGGYNWQSDSIVFGLEGDISHNFWKDKGDFKTGSAVQEASVDTLGSIRARLGIATGDALIYATGGVALSDAEYSNDNGAGFKDSTKFNNIGAVVGGGAELMVSPNMSIRAEGLYYIFNDQHDVSSFNRGRTGDQVSFDNAIVARVGVTWHFK